MAGVVTGLPLVPFECELEPSAVQRPSRPPAAVAAELFRPRCQHTRQPSVTTLLEAIIHVLWLACSCGVGVRGRGAVTLFWLRSNVPDCRRSSVSTQSCRAHAPQ